MITLIRGDRTIANAIKNQNFFTFDLALPSQVISAISKTMVITNLGQPTYLVNKNKRI